MSHQRSEAKVKAKNQQPGTSVAEKSLKKLNEKNMEKLQIMFRTAHALASKARPFTDFVWMCKLDQRKSALEDTLTGGQTYMNDKACQTFTHFISQSVADNLKREVTQCKFVSVIVDGATDTSVKEQELFFVRYCSQGEPVVKFLGIEAPGKANAQNIHKALEDTFKSNLGLPENELYTRLVCFASDGASVNTGRKSGVVARLKDIQPELVGLHCSNHRLELSYKDVFRKVEQFRAIDVLLLDLYLFYEKSSLNRANLYEARSPAGLGKNSPVVPLRVGGTRWVTHMYNALKRLITAYPAIVLHLSQVKDGESGDVQGTAKAKARGLHKRLTSSMLVIHAHFLMDILDILSEMSVKFQRRECTVAEVQMLLKSSMDSLESLKDVSPQLDNIFQVLQVHTENVNDDPEEAENPDRDIDHRDTVPVHVPSFKGVEVTGKIDVDGVLARKSRIIGSLISAVESRFIQTRDPQSDKLMQATIITSFQDWPPKPGASSTRYGNANMMIICDHFKETLTKAGVNVALVLNEWLKLKSLMYNRFSYPFHKADDQHGESLQWCRVFQTLRGKTLENVFAVIDLLLTLSPTSVECERGFSHMKVVKSDWRSRLTNLALTSLMRIILDGPTIEEFHPETSINLWLNASVGRRPNRKPSCFKAQDNTAEKGETTDGVAEKGETTDGAAEKGKAPSDDDHEAHSLSQSSDTESEYEAAVLCERDNKSKCKDEGLEGACISFGDYDNDHDVSTELDDLVTTRCVEDVIELSDSEAD